MVKGQSGKIGEMPKENRTERYGRALANWINFTIGSIPETEKTVYRQTVIEGLENFAVVPRKRGEPNGNSCELEGMEEIEIRNPENLVKIIREGIHLMYQKDIARRVVKATLQELKRGKIDQ